MSEPGIPAINEPRPGGWPRLMVRLEPVYARGLTNAQAYYELACISRQFRMGVVVELDGVDVSAFPHQTVDEIARCHLRTMRDMAAAADRLTPQDVAA